LFKVNLIYIYSVSIPASILYNYKDSLYYNINVVAIAVRISAEQTALHFQVGQESQFSIDSWENIWPAPEETTNNKLKMPADKDNLPISFRPDCIMYYF